MLSYNRPELLRRALASVIGLSYPAFEIIVVDNDSPASPRIEDIVGSHVGVRLVRTGRNVGFTGGMNRGIAVATGRYLYLTEDDLVSDRECARVAVDYLQGHPEVGLATGIMYNEDDGTIRCAGGEVSLDGVYRQVVFGQGERDGRFREPFDVSYIPGAMVFARTGVMRELGGFREEFFMYLEDVELCVRARAAGYRIAVIPGAKAHHFRPASTVVPQEIAMHKLKNVVTLYLLHARAAVLPEFLIRYAVAPLIRQPGARRFVVRALRWVAGRLPRLVRERRDLRRRWSAARG